VEGAAGSRHDPAVTFRNPCYQLTFPIVRTMGRIGKTVPPRRWTGARWRAMPSASTFVFTSNAGGRG